jgi:hypothetical protein
MVTTIPNRVCLLIFLTTSPRSEEESVQNKLTEVHGQNSWFILGMSLVKISAWGLAILIEISRGIPPIYPDKSLIVSQIRPRQSSLHYLQFSSH